MHFVSSEEGIYCLAQQRNLDQWLVLAGRSCAWAGAAEFLEILMLSLGAPWQRLSASVAFLAFEWTAFQGTKLWMLWL
jgi:hypothetical protein